MSRRTISYRVGAHAKARLIVQAGLLLPSGDAMRSWLRKGDLYAAAYVDEQLIGLATLDLDPYWKACVVGTYVDPNFRCCTVGATLVRKLLAKLPFNCNGIVHYAPGAEEFFDPLLASFGLKGKTVEWLEDVELPDRSQQKR